ncbi:LLM class F420-dependent oxidoreductase [Streptomyces sp. NPDC054796]
MTRPFRFGVNMVTFSTGEEWRQRCRRAEELGYDTLHVADHLGMPAPFTALASAAETTSRVRLGTFVLNVGFWNPALLAREVATCDQISGGRLELGLGTGYVKAEHDRAGLPWDAPRERVDRLRHTVEELNRLLADEEHVPRPAQRPVPLLIGGNGNRVLRLAAEHAQVAAFTGGGQVPGKPEGTLALLSPDALEERVTAYRGFATARPEPAELNILVQQVVVTDDRRATARDWGAYGTAMTEDDLLHHPALLAGTVKEIAEQLRSHRERYGFSYVTVLDPAMETFAPVIEELRGT